MKPDLPIDSHLPRICDELSQNGRLVLIAEPGAGKTTRVPPAILDRVDSDGGQVLLLQPRRVAALSAATRIATERDGDVGGEVGYQVRFERRLSSSTRVRVVTTGILLRELQRDPFLSDVACVIFDEFHERSLESDLCLSLVDEVRRDARPELSVLVMSATLDAKPISKFLDDAPVVEVEGRPYPLEISYRPRALRDPIELHVRAALEETWSERKGNALVFLPGIGAIRNCERELGGFAAKTGAEICCLYGSQSLDEQARILRPSPTSRRVILSTNVAETSLTIECVDLVVDSGLVRELISDPRVGVDRLETNRVSQHSAEQRAGRAGRLGPGRVVRLWSAAEQATLAEQTTPEVRRVDLAAAVLQLKAWGLAKPQDFRWFEPPSGESIERAVRLLEQLGATEAGDGAIGEIGHALLRFGCHPRIARVLYEACRNGFPEDGARIAALLDERDFLSWIGEDRDASGLSPMPSDVLWRLEVLDGGGDVESGLWRVDRSARRGVDRLARQFERSAKRVEAREVEGADRETTLLKALLVGFPDRVARRRSRGSERARMVGGRGLRQLPSSRVTEGEFFLALRVDESVRGERLEGRVTLASHVTRAWIESAFPQDVEERTEHRFDAEKEKVRAFRCVRYRDLPLEDEREVRADPEEATEILKRELATRAVDILESDPDSSAWFARYRWVKENCETLDLPSWNANDLAEILAQHCRGGTDFKLLRQPNAAANALLGALTYEQSQAIERNAPAEIDVPSGRSIPLKYEGNGPPVLAVKLQEMFGLADTPRIGGGTHPVLLHLLAPNRRPVQVTQDLKSFWDTTYAQVRKDLRGRYPKHPWPEDPWSAAPTKGTKKRPR